MCAVSAIALAAAGHAPAAAQFEDDVFDEAAVEAELDAALDAADDEDDEVETFVVEGRRVRGTTLTDVEPEIVLGEEEIAAYGASSFAQLLAELAPETSSGRGRRGGGGPVVLLNGRRISGFREIGRYPTEALARVEVLPEEVSLAYGFSADQRVINFILKPDVTIMALEGRVTAPDEGGSTSPDGSLQRLNVDGDERFSLDASGGFRPPILENERDILFAGDAAAADVRTLIAERDEWRAGFSLARGFLWGSAATLSGSFEQVSEDDLLGEDLSGLNPALQQERKTDDANLGFSVVSRLAPTTWNFTANYNRVEADTATDLNVDDGGGGFDAAVRTTSSVRSATTADFVVNTQLAALSAGPLSATGQAGFARETQDIEIDDVDNDVTSDASRTTFSARGSLDAPVVAPGPIPGTVSFNGNIEVEDLSDFGTLLTYGYGINWRPIDKLRIIASTTVEEGAPALSAVGDPTIVTPNARVFDFSTGTDVFATVVSGGNPDLIADDRRVFKVGVQVDPIKDVRFRINIDYTRSRIDNETRSFPLLTEEVEAAFPDRVLRDAAGTLVSFDRRPVVAARTERQELRTGITW
ncbi:MAG: hypothetical protein AAGC56_02605, partial [Pseudomonadota bacterium]